MCFAAITGIIKLFSGVAFSKGTNMNQSGQYDAFYVYAGSFNFTEVKFVQLMQKSLWNYSQETQLM